VRLIHEFAHIEVVADRRPVHVKFSRTL
jgi:hypothetical protein